jgi:hypothetical protein
MSRLMSPSTNNPPVWFHAHSGPTVSLESAWDLSGEPLMAIVPALRLQATDAAASVVDRTTPPREVGQAGPARMDGGGAEPRRGERRRLLRLDQFRRGAAGGAGSSPQPPEGGSRPNTERTLRRAAAGEAGAAPGGCQCVSYVVGG